MFNTQRRSTADSKRKKQKLLKQNFVTSSAETWYTKATVVLHTTSSYEIHPLFRRLEPFLPLLHVHFLSAFEELKVLLREMELNS